MTSPYLQVQPSPAAPAFLRCAEDEQPGSPLLLQPPAPINPYLHYYARPPSLPDTNAQAERDSSKDAQFSAEARTTNTRLEDPDPSNLSMQEMRALHAELVRSLPPPEDYYFFSNDEPGVQEIIDACNEIEHGQTKPMPLHPQFPIQPPYLYAWPMPAVPSNQQFKFQVLGPEDFSSGSSSEADVDMDDPIVPLDVQHPSPVDPQAGYHVDAMASGSNTQSQSTVGFPPLPSTQSPPQLDPNTRCGPTSYSKYNHTFASSIPYTSYPHWVPRNILYHICRMPGCGELVLSTDSAAHCKEKNHYKECRPNGCPWELGKGRRCGKKGLAWGEHFSRTHFQSNGGWCTCCGHYFPTDGGYESHVQTVP